MRNRPVTAGTQLMFRGGDRVREVDGSHLGVVIAQWGWTVRVQWDNTRWKEDLHPQQLVEVSEPPFEPDARIVWEDA